MPVCVTCGKVKDESEFNWRWKALGIRHPTCRECHKTYRKNWYEANKEKHLENVYERKQRVIHEAKEYVWNYLLTHPCVDCGQSDPTVLEFDHVNGKDKDISMMAGQGYSIAAIEKEIGKCVVRCANCHRRKTAKELGWFRR